MKEQIQEYVAPDLSGFDKRLDVFKEKMISVEESVSQATDYTREIKNDLKKDVARLEKSVDAAERRTKNTADAVRTTLDQNENKIRSMVTKAEDRFDTRREQIRNDMTSLENRINKRMTDLEATTSDKIKKALENPLAKMR
jgi:DNA anti-recombination protein RmuC